jgi:hypothetical protein
MGSRVREESLPHKGNDGETLRLMVSLLLEWQAISPDPSRTEWPKTLPAS